MGSEGVFEAIISDWGMAHQGTGVGRLLLLSLLPPFSKGGLEENPS